MTFFQNRSININTKKNGEKYGKTKMRLVL